MPSALLLTLHFHEPRYHGMGDWPPAPMRLFQALVAGAAQGARLTEADRVALEWLEGLDPPDILAPAIRRGSPFIAYMPNNDADASADPTEAPRIGKTIQPILFESDQPLCYLWSPVKDCAEARQVCALAGRLHHLGRGVDPAWAEAVVLDAEDAEERMRGSGVLHRVSGDDGNRLAVPVRGSLASLEHRYAANRTKFRRTGTGRSAKTAFTQPPKAVWREAAYNAPPHRLLYELRGETGFDAVLVEDAARFVKGLVHAAAARLSHHENAERLIVGKDADNADKARRIRVIPIPTIREHIDRSIRRVMIEVPQACPIRRDDLDWAFSGLTACDEHGEVLGGTLTPAQDTSMADRYCGAAAIWQTETPAALSLAKRRRIDPEKLKEERNAQPDHRAEAKLGSERAAEEKEAKSAVMRALRQAGTAARPFEITVQREPFEPRGVRADACAEGSRFSKHALWHVRLHFPEPVSGPLVIGDGRWLGLGVMSPVRRRVEVLAFAITGGLEKGAEAEALAEALRRAMMARVQAHLGGRGLDAFFTGHQPDGARLSGGAHRHVAAIADLERSRLLLLPPHLFDRKAPREGRRCEELAKAMAGLAELRAGAAGKLSLAPEPLDRETDPLFAASTRWESLTPYAATRHPRRQTVEAALIADAKLECHRRGFPEPGVEVLDILSDKGRPTARLRLTFKTAQPGPILLGRTMHKGGGVFSGKRPERR